MEQENVDKAVAFLQGIAQVTEGVPKRFFEILWHIWQRGNEIARTAIVLDTSWFIVLVLSAVTGFGALTNLLALLPLVAAFTFLVAKPGIFILLEVTPNKKVRKVFDSFKHKVWFLLGFQLTVGLYFQIVPVKNEPKLVFPLMVVCAALIAFAFAGDLDSLIKKYGSKIAAVLFLVFVVITLIFVLGGTEKAKEKLNWDKQEEQSSYRPSSEQYAPAVNSRFYSVPVCPGEVDQTVVYDSEVIVTARPGCWSGIITIPPGARYNLHTNAGLPGFIHILFRDGTEMLHGTPAGEREGVFRIISTNEEIPVTISVTYK